MVLIQLLCTVQALTAVTLPWLSDLMENSTLLNHKMPGIGHMLTFREINSLTGLNMPPTAISTLLICHSAPLLKPNSMRKLLKISSSQLKVSHTDITTSSSDGSIQLKTIFHLSSHKNSCQFSWLFSPTSPPPLLTVFISKPWTRDLV